MALSDIIRSIERHTGRAKIVLDKYVDPTLFWLSSNSAALYGSDKVLDYVSKNVDSNEGLAMMGTYAGLATGLGLANKHIIVPLSKKIHNYHDRKLQRGDRAPATDWLRTLGQIGSMITLYVVTNFGASLDNFKEDGKRIADAFARDDTKITKRIDDERQTDITPPSLERRLPVNLDPTEIKESNINSTRGKFLRTLRWDSTISEMEKKYNIESGLLAGLIMRESMGNPLQLNGGGDGGAGLMMFQPGTARQYGLDIYGSSRRTGRDRNHGRKLRELVRNNNYNYDKLGRLDERFDVEKSMNAGAHYLSDLKRRFGTWDRALRAYNAGTPKVTGQTMRHQRSIRSFQKHYLREREKYGLTSDLTTITILERSNGHDFEYRANNSEGRDIYRTTVREGDNPTLIAQSFNEWDKRNGDKFKEVDYSNIVRNNGNFVGSRIKPGQRVYVAARKR